MTLAVQAQAVLPLSAAQLDVDAWPALDSVGVTVMAGGRVLQ